MAYMKIQNEEMSPRIYDKSNVLVKLHLTKYTHFVLMVNVIFTII